MSGLGAPASVDSLYLARGADVEPLRPILQGDVFCDVDIPGVDPSEGNLAMVVGHACSIRAGAHLRSHLLLARVRSTPYLPLDRWSDGHFREMPLPELLGAGSHFAALFDECGRVPSNELIPDRRLACLDRQGIVLLQQRIAFHHTRVEVGLGRLHEVSAGVLEEVDLLEDWLIEFVPNGEPARQALVNTEEEAFDLVLRAERDGQELRKLLDEPSSRATVRRAVREAMRLRREGPIEPA